MGKAAGRLKEAALEELAEEAGVGGVTGQGAQAGGGGSRAAAVRERLEQVLPEKLRPGLEVGRWLPGLQLGAEGSTAAGPAGLDGTRQDGAGGVDGAVGRLKTRLKDVKEELGSEDLSVRKLGEKVRAAAGSAATVVAAAEEETRPSRACQAENAETDAGADGTAGRKWLRGFVQKARSKLEGSAEVVGYASSTQSGCGDKSQEGVLGQGRETAGAVGEVKKVEERVKEQKGDRAVAPASQPVLPVLGLLPTWMMFW